MERPQLTLVSQPQSAIALSRRAVAVAVKAKTRPPLMMSVPDSTIEPSAKPVSRFNAASDADMAVRLRPISGEATGIVALKSADAKAAEGAKPPSSRRVETWAPSAGREGSPLITATASTAPASTAPVFPAANLAAVTSTSTAMAPNPTSARSGAAQLPSRGGLVLKTKPVELRPDVAASSAAPGSAATGAVAGASRAASREAKAKEMPAVSASERLLLAQLDADLGRAQSRLDRAESRLSEGQKQLGSFTDVLRDAMLEAGDDAHGLHPFVRVAQRYLGTPYVWGGESARGFDCSGFIMRVMRDLGYRALPHSAAEQFRYGLPVAKPLLKPGDVVFFANTYKPGISHVGIYLGHGRFIHAANSHVGTIVSSLNEPKWVEKYAGARRLLPVKS